MKIFNRTNRSKKCKKIAPTSSQSKAEAVTDELPTRTDVVPKQLVGATDLQLQTVSNYNNLFTWEAEVFRPTSFQELINKVAWCRDNNIHLRVRGSGWSFSKILDPTSETGKPGVNIMLDRGDFVGVHKYDEASGTIKVGAGTQRGPVYEELHRLKRGLLSSGECYTIQESQVIGALIANAVHDSFQQAFTPETVESLEVLFFGEDGNPIIRSFNADDGDSYFAHFGGMGFPGIIVSATLHTEPTRYYHRLPYLPGVDYIQSFHVGENAPPLTDVIKAYNILPQGSEPLPNPDELLKVNNPDLTRFQDSAGSTSYVTSFPNALRDFVLKYHELKDVAVCGFLFKFPDPFANDDDTPDDGLMPVYGDSRMYIKDEGKIPNHTLSYTKFDDVSPFMGKEYMQSPSTIGNLWGDLVNVQASIRTLEWKHANLLNFPNDVEGALSNEHWAYLSTIEHLTGPSYIYTFEKAVEFYINEEDIVTFAEIAQRALMAMGRQANTKSLPFADVRYAVNSGTAFFSPFYGKNKLAIDFGVSKGLFTWDQYKDMVTRILKECKAEKIPVRLHTGKFYVYDQDLTHYMYDTESRRRFTNVLDRHDPYNVFAPKQWRDLFTLPSSLSSSKTNR